MCSILRTQLDRPVRFFRLPQFCPLLHGLPLHVVAEEPGYGCDHSWAILDVRRVMDAGGPGFALVPMPSRVNLRWVKDRVVGLGLPEHCVHAAFLDEHLLLRDMDALWPVHLVTCMPPPHLLPGSGRLRLPALLDTCVVLNQRIGIWQSSFRCVQARQYQLSLLAPRDDPAPLHFVSQDPYVEYDPPTAFDPANMPNADAFECIVHPLHEASMRIWVPRHLSFDDVCALVGRLTGVPDARILWPASAPRLPGHPCHLVAVPSYASQRGLAIVDARRVYPAHNLGFWLVRLPARMPRAATFAELLGDRRICLTPSAVIVDGVMAGRIVQATDSAQTVTIFASAFDGQDCVFDNHAALEQHPGFRAHLQCLVVHATTLTTTGVMQAAGLTVPLPALSTGQDGTHPFGALQSGVIEFHIASARGDVRTIPVRARGLVRDVLAELCQELLNCRGFAAGEEVRGCPRLFCTPRGVHVFLSTRRTGASDRCWVFAPQWTSRPLNVRCHGGIGRTELLALVGAPDAADTTVSLGGAMRFGRVRPSHGDVVIIASLARPIPSAPLLTVMDRIPDVQAVLLCHPCPALEVIRQRNAHLAYWQHAVRQGMELFGLHVDGVYCMLAGPSFPCLAVCLGSDRSPVTSQVQDFWDRRLAPLFGACLFKDSGLLDRGRAIYVPWTLAAGMLPWVIRLPTGIDVLFADVQGDMIRQHLEGRWSIVPIMRCEAFGIAHITQDAPTAASGFSPAAGGAYIVGIGSAGSSPMPFGLSPARPSVSVAPALPGDDSSSAGDLSGVPSATSLLQLQTKIRPVGSVAAQLPPRPIATPLRSLGKGLGSTISPVELSDRLPEEDPVDSLRCLLRSILIPWVHGWIRDLSCLSLPGALRAHFENAPLPMFWPIAFWLFTDGSSACTGAGCGVVLIAEHLVDNETHWSFLGWLGHSLRVGSTNIDAESAGLRLALSWALGTAWCVPTHIVSDCEVALASAQGFCQVLQQQLPLSVHRDARHICQMHQCGHSLIAFHWVPSHQGIAANELVDAVAKAFAGRHPPADACPGFLHTFWGHPLLPWAWLLFEPNGTPTLAKLLSPDPEPADELLPAHVRHVLQDVLPTTIGRREFHLRMCTANVCSLREKHAFIHAQLQQLHLDVVALQETRAPGSSAFVTDGWMRYGTAGDRGHGGCALWFRQLAFGADGHTPSLDDGTVLAQYKDWLAVRLKLTGLDLVFVCLHAPHTGYSEEAIRRWWNTAAGRLTEYARLAPLVILGDANAVLSHLSCEGVGGLALQEPDVAGEASALRKC